MSLTSYQAAPPRVLRRELCRIERRTQTQKLAPRFTFPRISELASRRGRIERQHFLWNPKPPGGFADRFEYSDAPVRRPNSQRWIFASRATASVGTKKAD